MFYLTVFFLRFCCFVSQFILFFLCFCFAVFLFCCVLFVLLLFFAFVLLFCFMLFCFLFCFAFFVFVVFVVVFCCCCCFVRGTALIKGLKDIFCSLIIATVNHVFQSLDKVIMEMSTCDEPRPPNGPSPIATASGQRSVSVNQLYLPWFVSLLCCFLFLMVPSVMENLEVYKMCLVKPWKRLFIFVFVFVCLFVVRARYCFLAKTCRSVKLARKPNIICLFIMLFSLCQWIWFCGEGCGGHLSLCELHSYPHQRQSL